MGAAWKRSSEKGRDILSVMLDDPGTPPAFQRRIVSVRSRRARDSGMAATEQGAGGRGRAVKHAEAMNSGTSQPPPWVREHVDCFAAYDSRRLSRFPFDGNKKNDALTVTFMHRKLIPSRASDKAFAGGEESARTPFLGSSVLSLKIYVTRTLVVDVANHYSVPDRQFFFDLVLDPFRRWCRGWLQSRLIRRQG